MEGKNQLMVISYWKRDRYISKKIKNDKKLKKFLVKKEITMFDMNGQTYAYIGGIK